MDLRLLTFNALFKGDVRPRVEAIAARLEASDYDVVCLQEVVAPGLARLLGRRAGSFAHVRYTGQTLVKGGLVLLSRHPIAGYRFIRYPSTRPIRPELLMRKGAQIALLDTAAGRVAVVNTHLSANRDDDWTPQNRWTAVARTELSTLTAAMQKIDPSVPAVVAGDFNLPRESEELARFCAAAGLRDAMAGDPRPTYRPTPKWPSPPALDHVLLRGDGLRATCRQVLTDDTVTLADGRRVFLSDHYGLAADLTVRAAPRRR